MLHRNASSVPEQVPVRNSLLPQLMFEHVAHLKPSLVPEQDPVRNWLVPHVIDEQTLHRYALVVPLQEPDLWITINSTDLDR